MAVLMLVEANAMGFFPRDELARERVVAQACARDHDCQCKSSKAAATCGAKKKPAEYSGP